MQKTSSLGVAEAARRVMGTAASVHIDDELVERFCHQDLKAPAWDDQSHLPLGMRSTDWETANYVLVLDALNFCFWPDAGEPRWIIRYQEREYGGYWALTAALRRAVDEGVPLLQAEYLAEISLADVERILAGPGRIPLIEARRDHLREVGQLLVNRYDKRFIHMMEDVGRDAVELVRRVTDELPCFRDETTYHGDKVPFYKRAQILAADLHGTFHGAGWGNLSRLDALTAFADYKVPQVLRHLGMLAYTSDLAAVVDGEQLIASGHPHEVEIRAATVEAVERIRQRVGLRAYEVDFHLWNQAQQLGTQMRPYHRTRTVFY